MQDTEDKPSDRIHVTLRDKCTLRERFQVRGMERHYPIMINTKKRKKKKAATFSKCHFGSFQLTSDHNSLSFTIGCTYVYSQPKKKLYFEQKSSVQST